MTRPACFRWLRQTPARQKFSFAVVGFAALLGAQMTALPAQASTVDCEGLFVNKISQSTGSLAIQFVNAPGDPTESKWMRFTGWTDVRVDRALSVLLTALALGRTLDIGTTAGDGCSIWTANQDFDWVMLQPSP